MIIQLSHTSTHEVAVRLRQVREERGEVATGRVLTFIASVTLDDAGTPSGTTAAAGTRSNATGGEQTAEQANAQGQPTLAPGKPQPQRASLQTQHLRSTVIDPVNDAASEHPARVIVLVNHSQHAAVADESFIDAEIHIGGDSGASELIILHLHGELGAHQDSVVTPLLLPDTPVVVWWPFHSPRNPAADPLGQLAARRITDACAEPEPERIYRRRLTYTPGDSDLAWSRITLWRGVLASALDQPPFERVLGAEVYGPEGDASVDIAAGWLAVMLDVPVQRISTGPQRPPRDADGAEMVPIQRTILRRHTADVEVEAIDSRTMSFRVGDNESRVALTPRTIGECLSEELRHLDADEAYKLALKGLVRVGRTESAVSDQRIIRLYEDRDGQESQR